MAPPIPALLLLCALLTDGYAASVPVPPQTGNEIPPSNGNGTARPAIRHMRPWILPFPQAMDDLQLFPYENYLIVTGSRFISIESDDTCWRCEFSEDFNHCIQLNQTICNETISNGECPRGVAELVCTTITSGTAAGPIYIQVQPFQSRRPSCYIRKGGLRLQPVYDSQIYLLQPAIESCNFAIARYIPPRYLQTPSTHP